MTVLAILAGADGDGQRCVVDPESQTSRARACPHQRSGPPHPGQASSPAARSSSACLNSTIPIIAVSLGAAHERALHGLVRAEAHLLLGPPKTGGG
ncbi:MAG: hypothetical protein DLM61_23520 [Pseudonocardiales bacterium]|nr:MAG: hypothetical protein DLM61_23520 [Pseudonocardiales bacterium]